MVVLYITECIVEYTTKMDGCVWNSCTFNLSQESMIVQSLLPSTVYSFRVKMKNKEGESLPSNSVETETTPLVPGPPLDMQVSSKQTRPALEINWKQPSVNPQAVSGYNLQMRRCSSKVWTDTFRIESHSLEVTNLTSSTQYVFRVQSVNNAGEGSEWSNEIETRTCGKLHHAFTAIGCAFNGVKKAPVVV